jgi:hypothetical protein
MGAYHELPPLSTNASLIEILNWREGVVLGQSDTVKAVLYNTGLTTLTTATIAWTFNGTSRTPVTWSGTLTYGQSTVINLGAITYTLAENSLQVWVSSLGGLTDDYLHDDTVEIKGYVCATALSGVYTVGATGFFSSLSEVWEILAICGAGGDIILEMETGNYNESIDLTDITLLLGGNKLTITSATHHAEDVVFITNSVGVILSRSNNIVLRNITIDATAGTCAVQFTGACTNVVIRDCRLLANPSATSTTMAPVYKANTAGVVDSIFIINNLLNGGYYGLYFSGGTNYSFFGKHVVFDSNTVSNQYSYGVSSQYTDFTSVSYNRISNRTSGSIAATWNGLYFTYCNGNIIGNRILQQGNFVTQPCGIYMQYFNYYNTSDTGIVVNNEIILKTSGNYQGIYANTYTKVKIVHNSILVSGSGAARGIQIGNHLTNYMAIKNNNIVMTATGAYPVYLNAITNLNLYDMDYNNMSAPTYAGFAGNNVSTMVAWRQFFPNDLHSVSIHPHFIDSAVSLELSDYSGLSCPSYPGITMDINGYFRTSMTTVGVYNGIRSYLDLGIERLICKDTAVLYSHTIPVKMEIINRGSGANIDSATFGWSVNGEQQSSYTWIASTPLGIEEKTEIGIGSFSPATQASVFNLVVWIESVNGSEDSVKLNDTARISVKVLFTDNNLRVLSIEPLVPDGVLCTEDYTSVKIKLANTGISDYDFSIYPVKLYMQVTQPESFYLDTIISSGILQAENETTIELTDMFPIVTAGQYDIKVWVDSMNSIVYDDTLLVYYVSGKFGLPIDEDFSNGMPTAFNFQSNNVFCQWKTISQGMGADTVVLPQFGTGMLAFVGSPGSIATLSTQQLDLSQTVKPALSFWYFHDTISCEDYTDVRITVDGGTTYNTLFSLTKYNTAYGWQQYSMDLPAYAVNQCVILVFEAMEKSRSGDVTQYIDRIRITARQDITISEIITSELTACDLQNKELKVVLSNLTDPVLDFAATNTTITLEIKEMGQTFIHTLDSGSLGRFASDTISMATGIDFSKGTYTFKAYFSSVLDVDRQNDTLVRSIVINPSLSVSVHPESNPANCLTGELGVNPTITLYNTGNMDLSNIDMILQIDTGDNNIAVYALFKETYTGTIHAGDTAEHMFANSFTVPWNARYDVRTYTYLSCDSALVNSTTMITECVDIKDLRIISIDNPSGTKDAVGHTIQVTTTLNNRSDGDVFNNVPVSVLVTNSQDVQVAFFTENLTVGTSETLSHTFNQSYTVPNDTVYYLTVYTNSNDNYRHNDTLKIRRETVTVGIEALRGIDGFTLSQNIPNPANNNTRIDYNIPEAGEVIFHVHSVSGQLLYSKTIETSSGKQSLELNTSIFAAGIYFYSIEYNGQRLVKRMMING